VFVHSLKLTVKAALRGVFSIAAMVTVITAFGLQKYAGPCGDGSNFLRVWAGMDQKQCGTVWGWV